MIVKKSNKYFSVQEAAEYLGKSIGQINLYIWLHLIKNVEKVGDFYIIPKDEIIKVNEKDFETNYVDDSTFSTNS